MIRAKITNLDIINKLHELKGKEEITKIEGYKMKVDSDRYDNFYYHGYVCMNCGLKAQYAAIEKGESKNKLWHVNVYGVRPDGREILFTKDHIYPKSLGGFDAINNYQTMCACCNGAKGDETSMTAAEAAEKGYTSRERILVSSELLEAKEKLKQMRALIAEQTKKVSKLSKEFELLNPPASTEEYL